MAPLHMHKYAFHSYHSLLLLLHLLHGSLHSAESGINQKIGVGFSIQ
ncbi:hypothetical protein Patl1_05610 [Pistacia atlantica]|uniref:Uncharacterized protein n=1 Tax=Pistacia atlantica TaxID=434234 RepID=A0ACC1BT26_9ROSI|nr:hypothetical protein Patl1_05610 [Pistacia atlantica]